MPGSPTRVVAVANLKGGVAKTTTAFALGDALAARGQRVLLVDLDPQAGLTNAAGLEPADLPTTIYTALMHYVTHRQPLALADYCRSLGERLDLLPANLELARAEKNLHAAPRREYLLDEALAPAHGRYDAVLIDCPPTMSLLTTNALTTAQELLIPLSPEYLAVRGLALLFEMIEEVRSTKLNPALTVVGVVLTMIDQRTTHNREMAQAVRASLGDLPVLGEVKRTIKAAEAPMYGQPVTRFLEGSEVALAYQQIADTLLARWGSGVDRLAVAVTPVAPRR
jgi:chromosome partitioning protein